MDCARAAILLPLGSSILNCQPVNKCSLVETAFLLLVTVSTVNMLTTVLNDSPVFPESDEEADLTAPLLMDSPQVREVATSSHSKFSEGESKTPEVILSTFQTPVEFEHPPRLSS